MTGQAEARAPYDTIADWYEQEFLSGLADDPIGVRRTLRALLGEGAGVCVEIGCGTGAYAAGVRGLGWRPVGLDLSAGMLRHARGRLPIAQADAVRLPLRDASVPAAITVMTHTDMPRYADVVREAARILQPGGVFVHIGVHPCFCGGFADRAEPDAILIRPGYLNSHWTKASWTAQGLRNKVGASHWPLPDLLGMFLDAGLRLDGFAEGGEPTPTVLGARARKLVN